MIAAMLVDPPKLPLAQPARSARLRMLGRTDRRYLFDVESGRIHPVAPPFAHAISESLMAGDRGRAELIASALGLLTEPAVGPLTPKSVPVRAISLAIAQKCNMGCTYCYAQQGGFGGAPKDMPETVARAAVHRLLSDASPGDNVTLAFMGGEPLSNRGAVHAVTGYAIEQADRHSVSIGFTITTNATLISDEDIALFQCHAFTVTVSIDGIGAVQDALRPFAGGRGSFARVAGNIERMVATERRRFRLLARATVTPRNLDLPAALDGLLAMGFDSVMFTPLLSAPSSGDQMVSTDFPLLLDQLIQCADRFRVEAAAGRVLQFANLTGMLARIHHYRREHYPCGAGGGYLAASADGDLFACHRFVEDDEGLLGNVESGISSALQGEWLEARNLRNQSPCTTCWARHLCAGSCHYDVLKVGRPACDYIRGWAEICLSTYAWLAESNPRLLDQIAGNAS